MYLDNKNKCVNWLVFYKKQKTSDSKKMFGFF